MDTLNRLKEAQRVKTKWGKQALEDRASERSPHPSSMSLHIK